MLLLLEPAKAGLYNNTFEGAVDSIVYPFVNPQFISQAPEPVSPVTEVFKSFCSLGLSNKPAILDSSTIYFDSFTDWNLLFQVSEGSNSQLLKSLNRYTTLFLQSQHYYQAIQSTVCLPENRQKQRPAFYSISSFNSSVPNSRLCCCSRSKKLAVHNIVEKQYRANLNNKIAVLYNSMPSLQVSTRQKDDIFAEGKSQFLDTLQKLTKVYSVYF